MPADTSLPLQKSIYSALTGDSALSALVTGVFDSVPQTQDYPYINIGDDTAVEWSTLTADGMQQTVTIHSWSRARGRSEVKTIMQNIYRILHKANLALTGATLVLLYFEFEHSELDPDGVTYHGVQRFRALTLGG